MSDEEGGRVPWKESNLALIGSDLDHKIKAAAAEGEEQWQGLGEGPGIWIWRIEQFRVVPWPLDMYGKFHVGDSYIVLNSYKKSDDSDALIHDVHIWIGSESSQDEYGTAAYKMVEADEVLGGTAIQHRQVQGHESDQFQNYFVGATLYYLPGGVATGFHKVEEVIDEPHLYKVKGTEKGMSLTQVPVSTTSLNAGDCFILFINRSTVFVWHGSSSNPDERARANRMGETMCTEGTVATMDQGDGDDTVDQFWTILGGYGDIAEAEPGDEAVEEFAPLLFKVVPGSEPEQIAKGEPIKMRFGGFTSPKLDRTLLNDGDSFILDAGWEVFVWTGKQADRSEKLAAMTQADEYCKEDPRTADVPLSICTSGYESAAFLQFFV